MLRPHSTGVESKKQDVVVCARALAGEHACEPLDRVSEPDAALMEPGLGRQGHSRRTSR